ncbi:hypothetical protein HMPREF1207_01855 [Paenibacillus sp. HGH0039]|nr:hypothetical protein HMPREF1207_01855 [Paenibacillus sp. HGH0039]
MSCVFAYSVCSGTCSWYPGTLRNKSIYYVETSTGNPCGSEDGGCC